MEYNLGPCLHVAVLLSCKLWVANSFVPLCFPLFIYLYICYSMGQYGISPERFQENQNLSSFFKVLTTSTDEDNKVLNVFVLFYLRSIHKVTLNIWLHSPLHIIFILLNHSESSGNNYIRSMSPQYIHTAIPWLPFNGIQRYYYIMCPIILLRVIVF